MENSNNTFTVIWNEPNFAVESIKINENNVKFNVNNESAFFCAPDEVSKIEIYFVPKYYKNKPIIKMFLHFTENLVTGGRGKNRFELKEELKGLYVSKNINSEDRKIIFDFYNRNNNNFKAEPYVSNKLYNYYKIFSVLPNIILLLIILSFVVWCLLTILF